MLKQILMSGVLMLTATQALAQRAPGHEPLPPPPSRGAVDSVLELPTESVNVAALEQCLLEVLARPAELRVQDNGYQLRSPELGFVFAQHMSCADRKATLSDVVVIAGTGIGDGAGIGSAMKADSLNVWAPVRREGCDMPVDYGVEIKNFRWFNWNDNTTDGGNKRFEIIRGIGGDQVRISTMSHLRLGDVIWSPAPDAAASPCAVSGQFEIQNVDVRWSRRGTAHGLLAEAVRGGISLPVTQDDARATQTPPRVSLNGTGLSITDITDSSTLRARRFSTSAEMSLGSAVPWAFLINKYAHDLVYRKADDSLLLRILPLDLANTFHFTTGTVNLSLPEATITPSAFLPSSVAWDLGSINMSSLFSGAEVAMALRGDQPGTFKMNARAEGVGAVEADVQFQTQLFGRDTLAAASRGAVNLQGKTGPGLTQALITFEDTGFSQAFLSLMKMRASTYVIRSATSHLPFWQQISNWLERIEGGQKSAISVVLSSPQVMLDGFWNRAPEGAIVRIVEAE